VYHHAQLFHIEIGSPELFFPLGWPGTVTMLLPISAYQVARIILFYFAVLEIEARTL
jgi:hypothetical protein